MADTSKRTLRLLSLLQHHRFWTGGELADRLEVSVRTLRRDIDRLRDLGYPVRSTRGVDGGYHLEPGATLPPLLLDNEEAIALVVGLHRAVYAPVAGIADASVRALTKVVQMLPPGLRREADALRTMTVGASAQPSESSVPSDVLAVIAQACRDVVRLRFNYIARDGAATARSVEPYRIVNIGQRFYLVAFDTGRDDWRTFRLDRMVDPEAARNSFDPRPMPADDMAAYIKERIQQLSAGHEVDVVVQAPAEEVEPRFGRWASVESEGVAQCRLRMSTESLDWPAFVLASMGVPFEIVSPIELKQLIRSWVVSLDESVPESTALRH